MLLARRVRWHELKPLPSLLRGRCSSLQDFDSQMLEPAEEIAYVVRATHVTNMRKDRRLLFQEAIEPEF